jgi:hypothetical protein
MGILSIQISPVPSFPKRGIFSFYYFSKERRRRILSLQISPVPSFPKRGIFLFPFSKGGHRGILFNKNRIPGCSGMTNKLQSQTINKKHKRLNRDIHEKIKQDMSRRYKYG